MRAPPPLFLRGRIWWCYVRPPGGKGRRIPRTTRCQDYKAAVEVWRDLERRSARPADLAAEATTLSAALKARRDERRSAGRAEGTLSMLEVKGRQLQRILGKHTPLSRIDAHAVDRYVAKRLSELVDGDGKQRKGARSTVHKELSTLRGTLRLAKRHGRYPRDLAEVMPEFSAKYTPKTRKLSMAEIGKLLKALPKPKAAIVAFILATGATYPSEAGKGLQVDMKRWLVHLPGTKRETRNRTIPVVKFARPWLRLAMQSFPFQTWSNVRRDIHLACDKAKIARCCPTDLRRSVASLMRAHGVPPSLIGKFLGHKDSRMAERVYGQLEPTELARLLGRHLSSTTRLQKSA